MHSWYHSSHFILTTDTCPRSMTENNLRLCLSEVSRVNSILLCRLSNFRFIKFKHVILISKCHIIVVKILIVLGIIIHNFFIHYLILRCVIRSPSTINLRKFVLAHVMLECVNRFIFLMEFWNMRHSISK